MAKVEVTMPKMGESITEGTIITWHKQPGDRVELDETLLEIGTDKVDTEVPAPAAGVVTEILVQEGDTVDVGTALALIETEADAAAAPAPEAAAPAPEEAPAAPEEPEPEPAPAQPAQAQPAPAQAAPGASQAAAPAAAGAGDVDVVMPQMGESIMEGTIIAWHKQPGDRVELDETLLEIATDKVDTEVPSPVAGTLRELLFQEGDTVQVGARIAVITTAEGAAAASAPAAPEAPAAQAPAQAGAPAARAEGTAEAGAAQGDGAAVEAEEHGAIPRKGTDGRFYSPLVRSIAEKEGLSLQELESIPGTGREGRVTKEDVLQYIEARKQAPAAKPAPAAQPSPAAPGAKPAAQPAARPATAAPAAGAYEGRVEIIEMDRMRQIVAEHMVRSKATSAHVTSFAEADVTNLVRLRERHKEAFLQREGIKLTYTPFFVQAAVEALRDHPLFNASVQEKQILIKKDFHVGIAVAIGRTGLVAPVIRNAGDKNLVGLARTAADLAERARNKQLQPDELQGGTFTITNIGSLGSIMGTPIINQPQVAILATGAIKKRPVVVEDPELGDVIAIRHIMYLSLSYDHRIIDGAMGSSFLQRFVSVLESVDLNMEI